MPGEAKRKREDAGDKASNKRKYFQSTSKAVIPLNSRGFLVSCLGGKERQAAQEAIALMTEYLSEETTAASAEPEVGTTDFTKLIGEEVHALRSRQGAPFEWNKTNVNGLIHISLTPEAGDVNPVSLVTKIAEDVQKTKQCKSRVCLRFLPIETVCQAKLGDISTAAKAMCQAAFPADADAVPVKFAVQYEHRASVSLKRGDVIDAVVSGVPQPPHVVNLNEPDKTIIVQLIRNYCAMSVVERYKQLGKFNLRELSLQGEEVSEASKRDGNSAAITSSQAEQPHAASPQMDNPAQPEADRKECLSTAAVKNSSILTQGLRSEAGNIQQKGAERTT